MSIQAYPYPVRPEKHPLYAKRQVKAVTREQLGNKIRFIALRWFERDETGRIQNIDRALDLYTETFRLCDVAWLEYTFLFSPNFKEAVDALADRGLYVFDFWGYVPGSGRTADNMWAEYQPPAEVYEYMVEKLGDHFIGFDNGEQDGRYIGGYSTQMCPAYDDRKRQYLNFQRHFQKLGDHMHNYTTVLASLMSLHYFAKDDNAIMLGSETAQALPSTNMWFSFIRGAGKQYGLLWYGNASVFNRWGFKSYFMSTNGEDSMERGDPDNGASLSLLKRILYTEYMYNSDMLGYDMGWLNDDHQCKYIDPKYCVEKDGEFLNPLGIVQENLYHFVEKNGNPGVLYTPVCIYANFFNGWQPPRHLYTDRIYTSWGNRPYTGGDHQMHKLFDLLYPGYNDCSYFRDERGFLTPTPFGDIADVILDDADPNLLKTYALMLVAGDGALSYESCRSILAYVQNGGHALLTADKLCNSPVAKIDPGYLADFGIRSLALNPACNRYDVELSGDACVIARKDGYPVISATGLGRGRISVVYVPYGIEPTGNKPHEAQQTAAYDGKQFNDAEMSIMELYRLVPEFQQYLSDCLDGTAFLRPTNRDLQYTVNIIDDTAFTLLVCNNTYDIISFDIQCLTTEITSVEELAISDVPTDAPGYYPPEKYVSRAFGSKGQGHYSIAPCDVRIFRIRTASPAVNIMAEQPYAHVNTGMYLTIPDGIGIKDYIIENPTVLSHFEGLKVHGRYFVNSDYDMLAIDPAYARRRGARIIVDVSSLINHYPDFSLLRNIEGRTEEAERRFESILKKAALFDCTRVLAILQRNAENALSYEDAYKNVLLTLNNLTSIAAKAGMTLYVQNGRSLKSSTTANPTEFTAELVQAADCGVKLAFNLCHSIASYEDPAVAIRDYSPSALLLSAPQRDAFGQMFDDHLPISASNYAGVARQCADLLQGCDFVCLDGVYENFDRVYADLELLR